MDAPAPGEHDTKGDEDHDREAKRAALPPERVDDKGNFLNRGDGGIGFVYGDGLKAVRARFKARVAEIPVRCFDPVGFDAHEAIADANVAGVAKIESG